MDTELNTFNSVEDECRFWKERAKISKNDWLNAKLEYDEFVELSRQMESEMDVALNQKENKVNELNSKILILENENDELRQRITTQGIELTNFKIGFELSQKEQEFLKESLRDLEVKNDKLERMERTLGESINNLSDSLDKAYEKNALLEMELEDKEALQEKIQRLTDELRDLRQEFDVKLRSEINEEKLDERVNVMNLATKVKRNKYNCQYKPSSRIMEKPLGETFEMIAISRKNLLNIAANILRKLNNMKDDLEIYRGTSSIKRFEMLSDPAGISSDLKVCLESVMESGGDRI